MPNLDNTADYYGLGNGIYAVSVEGIPIKIPGRKVDESNDQHKTINLFVEGRGAYNCPDPYILFQISTLRAKINVVIKDTFTKAQQDTLLQFCISNGNGLPMHLFSVSKKIEDEAKKVVEAYNIIANS